MQSKKFKTIDEYSKTFPRNSKERIETIRQIVKKVAPESQEAISYNMPAFKLKNSILIYFAAFQHHIGLYPYPSALKAFKVESSKYKTGKGSIQFPLNKPLPISLIEKIVKYRLKEKIIKKK